MKFRNTIIVLIGIFILSCSAIKTQEKSNSQFGKKQEIENYVLEAVKLIEKEGEASFSVFREKGSKWYQDNSYVFIYDTKGNRVVFPPNPQKEGENAYNVTDAEGTHQVQLFIETALSKNKMGWVHYKWNKKGESKPSSKHTFVMNAKTPSGKSLVVCAGFFLEK